MICRSRSKPLDLHLLLCELLLALCHFGDDLRLLVVLRLQTLGERRVLLFKFFEEHELLEEDELAKIGSLQVGLELELLRAKLSDRIIK